MGKLKYIVIAGIVATVSVCTIENIIGQQKAPQSAEQTAKAMKKKQWYMARKAKQVRDSALKAHMKHQTKAVRKRMKKDARKANDVNSGGVY